MSNPTDTPRPFRTVEGDTLDASDLLAAAIDALPDVPTPPPCECERLRADLARVTVERDAARAPCVLCEHLGHEHARIMAERDALDAERAARLAASEAAAFEASRNHMALRDDLFAARARVAELETLIAARDLAAQGTAPDAHRRCVCGWEFEQGERAVCPRCVAPDPGGGR